MLSKMFMFLIIFTKIYLFISVCVCVCVCVCVIHSEDKWQRLGLSFYLLRPGD